MPTSEQLEIIEAGLRSKGFAEFKLEDKANPGSIGSWFMREIGVPVIEVHVVSWSIGVVWRGGVARAIRGLFEVIKNAPNPFRLSRQNPPVSDQLHCRQ